MASRVRAVEPAPWQALQRATDLVAGALRLRPLDQLLLLRRVVDPPEEPLHLYRFTFSIGRSFAAPPGGSRTRKTGA